MKVELEPFFYSNNIVETSEISKSVSLCFSEDVDEIISNELQNPATFVTSLVGLISPIRQAMSNVSNTFNDSFPPDCQKASVPIQLQILCSLLRKRKRNTCTSLCWFEIVCISSHRKISPLGLFISYDSYLSTCNNLSLKMFKKYDLKGVFVASHLAFETFTIIAKDNIDLNAISTKVKKHSHGISVTTMQFPLKENQGVK